MLTSFRFFRNTIRHSCQDTLVATRTSNTWIRSSIWLTLYCISATCCCWQSFSLSTSSTFFSRSRLVSCSCSRSPFSAFHSASSRSTSRPRLWIYSSLSFFSFSSHRLCLHVCRYSWVRLQSSSSFSSVTCWAVLRDRDRSSTCPARSLFSFSRSSPASLSCLSRSSTCFLASWKSFWMLLQSTLFWILAELYWLLCTIFYLSQIDITSSFLLTRPRETMLAMLEKKLWPVSDSWISPAPWVWGRLILSLIRLTFRSSVSFSILMIYPRLPSISILFFSICLSNPLTLSLQLLASCFCLTQAFLRMWSFFFNSAGSALRSEVEMLIFKVFLLSRLESEEWPGMLQKGVNIYIINKFKYFMQEQAYKQLIKILDNNNLKDSAKALQKELLVNSENVMSFSKNNDQALKAINKVLKQKEERDKQAKDKSVQRENKRIQYRKQVSTQENEQIMESLISRLVKNQALLEDEKLNAKIEKFFDNQTFQKMVENVDVLQEMSSCQKETGEEVPQFGSKVSIPEEGKLVKEFSLQQVQQPQAALDSNMRSPSFGDNQVYTQVNSVRKNSQKVPKYESPQQRVKSSQKTDSNLKQEDMPSLIQANEQESSYFFQDSQSFLLKNLEENQQKSTMNRIKEQIKQIQSNTADEYLNDEDPGYDLYEVDHNLFGQLCKQLAEKYNYPQRITKKYNAKLQQFVQEALEEQEEKQKKKKDGKQKGLLPANIKFPQEVSGYPLHYDGIIYDGFNLRVVFDRERTGFEESKDFPIIINQIIAGRYEIVEYLGSAAFSKAIGCRDLQTNKKVCMKIIENNKDYLDQSIDEIKLLKYINSNTEDVDSQHVLKLYDYFYYKEHLFIVTEQLKENLYEYSKLYKETNNNQNYFSIGKLQKITKQILHSLEYLNSLRLIHCDLKPENILIKSYSKCEVKLIDFGSSCFIHDHLSSYVQSRSYRAPEVILGCKYDYRIDIWSLGCILAELYTGQVIFQNESIAGLLARVAGIIGPIPERMFAESRLKSNYFTSEKLIYQDANQGNEQSQSEILNQEGQRSARPAGSKVQVLVTKKSSLKHRLRTDDPLFLDFVTKCLEIDPLLRFSASEALLHPWLTNIKYKEGL